MAHFQIVLTFTPDPEGNVLNVQSALATEPGGSDSSSVDANGNISVGKGDTAEISFKTAAEGWSIAELELKDAKKSKFGAQPGGKARLTKKEAEDFGIDRYSGTRYGSLGMTTLTLNDSNKNKHTVNFCVYASDGNRVLVSDPRIRDGGGPR